MEQLLKKSRSITLHFVDCSEATTRRDDQASMETECGCEKLCFRLFIWDFVRSQDRISYSPPDRSTVE